ncbi:MAG: hypothetical protein ACKV0T_29360 [Planctomycetales bacterium]
MNMTLTCTCGETIKIVGPPPADTVRCPKCQSFIILDGSSASTGLDDPFSETVISNADQPPRRSSSRSRSSGRKTRSGNAQAGRRTILGGAAAAAVLAAALWGTSIWWSSRPQPVETHESSSDASTAATEPPKSDSPPVEERYPRFKQVVHRLPDWLLKEAPFDVRKFFPEDPANDEAVRLYLDALGEFSAEMAGCFPEAEWVERMESTRRRTRGYEELLQRWNGDVTQYLRQRTDDDDAAVDRLLGEYQVGLEKLALAHAKPGCVFETGLEFGTIIPHSQAMRQAVKLLQLQALRALTRQDFAAAIAALESGLRCSRDLRPRGFTICQLVSIALDGICLNSIVPAILSTEGCGTDHCDRLDNILRQFRKEAPDLWISGIQTEYLTLRLALRHIRDRTGDFAPERVLDMTRSYSPALVGDTPGHALSLIVDLKDNLGSGERVVDTINTRLELLSDEEFEQEAKSIVRWYQDCAALHGLSIAQETAALAEIEARGKGTFLLSYWAVSMPRALVAIRRDETAFRGVECLIALKRWQLTHKEPPRDLTEILAASGGREVPIDPFSDQPFRMAQVAGRPVIYSIGPDGVDDQGAFDALSQPNSGPKELRGDLLFQLR